jgi:hypothetical protein
MKHSAQGDTHRDLAGSGTPEGDLPSRTVGSEPSRQRVRLCRYLSTARRGIGLALIAEADRRSGLDFETQRYMPEVRLLASAYLDRWVLNT